MELGGGVSSYDAAHAVLRSLVGTLAGPEDGLEDAWRAIKAAALVDAASSLELAVVQGLPNIATAHIPVYEAALAVSPAEGADDVQRRKAITDIWTAQIGADYPALRASIQAISAQADLDGIPEQYSTTTRFGKQFGPRPSDGSYGPDPAFNATAFPNFSTRFVVTVRWTLQPPELVPPTETVNRIADLLNASLPAWVDWNLHVGAGFFTDGGLDGQSILNLKLLGP